MRNLELEPRIKSIAISVNDVLNLCPENQQEQLFLQKFANMVKQELMNDMQKAIDNVKYFNNLGV